MRLTTTTGNCNPLRCSASRSFWYLTRSALQKTTSARSRSAKERHSEVDEAEWNACPPSETALQSCVARDSSSSCRIKLALGTLRVNITLLQDKLRNLQPSAGRIGGP